MSQQQTEFAFERVDAVGCAAPSMDRAALVAQWSMLVRETLPGMAERCSWPVTLDHCFMRICLDNALGRPWHTVVRRPAIRHLSDEQLARAIAVAESVVSEPVSLDALNLQSIRWRKAARLKHTQSRIT